MAYKIHPKYRVWVTALEASMREVLEKAFQGVFKGREIDALTPHQRKKHEANIHETSVQAWQKFFRICEDHRNSEWKKTRRATHVKK